MIFSRSKSLLSIESNKPLDSRKSPIKTAILFFQSALTEKKPIALVNDNDGKMYEFYEKFKTVLGLSNENFARAECLIESNPNEYESLHQLMVNQ